MILKRADEKREKGWPNRNTKFKFQIDNYTSHIISKEPIGSVSPKLLYGTDTKNIHGSGKSDLTLLSCTSQAYPVPLHR